MNEGNKNAEKYDEQTAIALFEDAIALARTKEYDFIGEIAMEMNTYHDLFRYLSEKFESCKDLHKQLLGYIESNCFSNAKKGKIKEAIAIVNLKSNYGWTDRQRIDNNITSTGLTISVNQDTAKEIERLNDRTDKDIHA